MDGLDGFVRRISWGAGRRIVSDTQLGFSGVEVAEKVDAGGVFTLQGIAVTRLIE